ncbi:MAG: hypothetical protein SF187_02865 [Deltaproteobacteria bacterium]|nr:hypothetical protein [Deltaproteobacteria bacterium]
MKFANVSLVTLLGLTAGLFALTNGACSVSGDGLETNVEDDSPAGGDGMNAGAANGQGEDGTGGIIGNASGGTPGMAGTGGTGGAGGTPAGTGGKGGSPPAAGGAPGKGGMTGTAGKGGSPATGGAGGMGGMNAGGAMTTGGVSGTGGANTGGTPGTGGAMATGGTQGTGGTMGTIEMPGTPDAIKCGTDVCGRGEYCCRRESGFRCLKNAAECGTSSFLYCDERSDCDSGQVCCGEATGVSVRSVCLGPLACEATPNTAVLCANSEQCRGGTVCCPFSFMNMSFGQCRTSCAN